MPPVHSRTSISASSRDGSESTTATATSRPRRRCMSPARSARRLTRSPWCGPMAPPMRREKVTRPAFDRQIRPARKRSEATKAQPRTDDRTKLPPGSGATSPATSEKKHVSRYRQSRRLPHQPGARSSAWSRSTKSGRIRHDLPIVLPSRGNLWEASGKSRFPTHRI